MNEWIGIFRSRLNQQNTGLRHFTKAGSHDTTGGTTANNHIVITLSRHRQFLTLRPCHRQNFTL